jgi:mono/diheme cytochrome c family protein
VKQLAAALALAVAGCASLAGEEPRDFYDPGPDGKTDAFGRRLAGVPSDYVAADLDEALLVSNMRARRDAAWATVAKVLEPVPLLGLIESAGEHPEIELPGGEEMPMVPRFETWYGVDDLKRIFQKLYEDLPPNQRAVRTPFSDESIAAAETWNATALDRSSRWPFERYLAYVRELGLCPEGLSDEVCAQLVQGKLDGAVIGNGRIVYSPAVVQHVMRNYGRILDCLAELDRVSLADHPAEADNFTFCFDREFPVNGVLVKAQWVRADFGRTVPAFDTDGTALAAQLGGQAHWGDAGDRQRDPSPADILTIRLHNGDTYRLVGMHIMTKELRHWQWITLWWSDAPDADFGADRPDAVRDRLDPVWRNYKMCVVDGYTEQDGDPAARFGEAPTLAAALRAAQAGAGGPTWCSNPYLERGRHNARTNCIGCHQHGGSTMIADRNGDGALEPLDLDAVINDEALFPDTSRRQIRDLFPADYLYSINRVDDFAHVLQSEVDYFDGADRDAVRPRIEHILSLAADPAAGAQAFAARCAPCHGATGEGSGWAPNLYTRVPNRDDESILQTLLQGRGMMPIWGDVLSDQELADVFAHLRATFGGGL